MIKVDSKIVTSIDGLMIDCNIITEGKGVVIIRELGAVVAHIVENLCKAESPDFDVAVSVLEDVAKVAVDDLIALYK